MSSPITVRICPATSNLPTRMTRQSWVALCRATQQREAGAASTARSWNENLSGQIAVGSNYCAECQGQHLPPGLEFIDAAELAALKTATEGKTMGKISTGTCDNCKRKGVSVQAIKGEKICASCASLYGAIGNRPEAVERALAMLAPDMLGQAVPVAVESAALNRIAEIVGYTGTDGDGLIAAVEAAMAKEPSPVASHCERSEAISGGLLDLARALGLSASTETPEEVVWLAAMQTAAMLDEADRALVRVTATAADWYTDLDDAGRDLGHIKKALGLPEDADASDVTGAIAELTQALNRFRNLAEAADARADRFAQAAEQAQSSADLLLAEKNLADERADIAEAQVTAIREALRAQESDESTMEVAERRMAVLAKLDKMYGESEERIGKIERHCEALKAENARLNDLLAGQNETVADYIDPYREAMADFGLRILRGEVCLINAVR